MNKILVIGLDGATWTLLKPWIEKGYLPTIKKLIKEGVHGVLKSTVPPLSIPAWNSIVTGKNPGKLGIFSFMSFNSDTNDFKPDFLYKRHGCVWDILGLMGKKVVVLNVPCVHKAHKVNGKSVVGFLYTDHKSLTYPENLISKLNKECENYEIDVLDTDETFQSVQKRFEFVKYLIRKESSDKYIENVHRIIEKRFKAIKILMEDEWDFAFVVFVAPDRVQHRFWENKNILLDVYKRIDRKLEKILLMIDDDTTIFLISDHGFGPKKRVFKINEWLLKEGYLKVNTINNHQDARSSYLSRTILKFPLMRSLGRFLPFQIQQYFRERLNKYRVNWEQTRVFTQPSEENYGDLYINLKYEGFTDNNYQDEYDKIVNEVIEKLTNFKDEKTGNNIPLKVLKRNDVYKGEYLNEAPDLIVLTDSNINGFNANIGNSKIFELGKGGEHRMEGIFVAHGPNIRKNVEIRDVDVYDITPTLLHIFNSPVSSSIDGKVIKEIFENGSDPETRDVSYTLDEFKQFNEDDNMMTDEEEIKNRLKKLGYI